MGNARVQVIKADQTAQTPHLPRRLAISRDTTAAKAIWMGRETTAPGKDSGAHHHGEAETSVFILSGHPRIYYGEQFQHYVDLGPGDFMYVAPFAPHFERNLSRTDPVDFITARTPDNIVVNLDIPVDFANHRATEAAGNEQIRVVRGHHMTSATAQPVNLPMRAGVSKETTGAARLWMGRATSAPGQTSGVHHHGEAETAAFVLQGNTRIYFGEGEYAEVGPGDFMYVPARLPHVERNLSTTAPVEFVTVRVPDNIVVPLADSFELRD